MTTIKFEMSMSEAESFRDQWVAKGPAHKYDVSTDEVSVDPSKELVIFRFWNGDNLEFVIRATGARSYQSLSLEEATCALEFADNRIEAAKRHKAALEEQIQTLNAGSIDKKSPSGV